MLITGQPTLQLPFFPGDNRAATGFTPRSRNRQHTSHLQCLLRLALPIIEFPYISLIGNPSRNRLCGIDHTASTDRQNKSDPLLPANLYPLVDQRQARVRLSAWQINMTHTSRLERCPYPIEQTAPLHTSLPPMQQYFRSVKGRLRAHLILGSPTENDLGFIVKNEGFHGFFLLVFLMSMPYAFLECESERMSPA
ncbi:MAG: hypothetical protein BWY82_02187 [Verrucomicrobia bacterium ADurb.Bin474]|nr:MAG: hypothetical protein BWY82_02187 [Verrucomicrobia bacterium ADurb.Bin474]